MNGFISNENFISAEKTASERDLRISDAVKDFCGDKGEIEILDACKVLELVEKRPENSHKGTFGRLVLIAGSDRFPGAAQIASLSALRSGVGLVTVITTQAAAAALAVSAKEATLLPLPSDERGFMNASGSIKDEIIETVKNADALLIGPGLGTAAGCLDILKTAIKNAACPIILDADGINLVCGRIEFLRKAKSDLILTPHPAELARLCGEPLGNVLCDRLSYAKRISDTYGCTVVSKSAGTLIVGNGGISLSVCGNNGLARGGSGDFLAGLIASFAAQGYPAEKAAKLGVTVQGLTCEAVSKRLSRRGMLPSDMIGYLPLLFKKIERLI